MNLTNDSASRLALLDTNATAALLQVAPRTLANWRVGPQPIGPRCIHVGRLVRYRLEDIEAYLDRQSRAAEARSRKAA